MSAYSAETRTRWLGNVPPEWNVAPAWSVFHERSEKSDPTDDRLTPSQHHGVLTQREYMELTGTRVVVNKTDSDVAKRVRPNDFIIHLRSFQGGIEHSRVPGKVTNAYTVLKPASGVDPRYYRHFLKSDPFISGLSAMTDQLRDGQSVNFGKFSTMRLPVPPLPTQRAIADYLDRETAEIDAMAAELDELVEMLETRRRVSLVVTQTGLTQPSGLYDTQTSWAPRIKAEWPMASAAMFLSLENRPVHKGGVGTTLLSLTKGGVVVRDFSERQGKLPASFASYQRVFPGDLVLCLFDMDETPRTVGLSSVEGMITGAYTVMRPDAERVDAKYLEYLLIEIDDRKAFNTMYSGLRKTIRPPKFLSMKFPLPPLDEQRRIVEHLDEVTAEIDSMIADAQELKALLSERRSALITEVVTGRKEVPVA